MFCKLEPQLSVPFGLNFYHREHKADTQRPQRNQTKRSPQVKGFF